MSDSRVGLEVVETHAASWLEAGLGDHEHSTHLDDILKLVCLVVEGNTANLSALCIQQIASEEFALASSIVPSPQV